MDRENRINKVFTLPSRTKQSFKAECDINKIVQRFKNVQGVDYLEKYSSIVGGNFGDFSNVSDYRTAIEQVSRAHEVFEQLPAVVRKRFDHDPAAFLDFVDDPKNREEMIQMGLLDTPKVDPGVSTSQSGEK